MDSSIPHRAVARPLDCGEGVEAHAVELRLQGTSLLVYNVYSSGRSDLDVTELFSVADVGRVIVGGDFNAHHEMLNSITTTNNAGRHLASLLEEYDEVKLLNTGEPTHLQGNALDLIFASAALAEGAQWQVHPTLTSDHFATQAHFSTPLPEREGTPGRWKIDKARWPLFQEEMATWWREYAVPDDVGEFGRDFAAALTRAAEASIPKTSGRRPPVKNWWFRSPRVREANHRVNTLRKAFRRNRTDENLRLLRQAVSHARGVANDEKEARWLEWCESFDSHTSLRTLWSCLRTASGRGPRRPAAHPDPEARAEELVSSYAERASSERLPLEVRQRQLQLRPERLRRIANAVNTEDVTDCPFTQSELTRAKRRSRDTAPGEDGITYTMLRNMGQAGESAFLALLNASWRVGRLPPQWKSAIVHPIPKPKEPEKTRPISLLSCVAKTAERMVLNRLNWKVGPPHRNVYGFAEGKSAPDSIASLLATINNQKAIVVFLDLEKAFELASPTAITDALASRGVSGRLLRWTHDYLSERTARVRFQGRVSGPRNFENGTPQGGVLSPTLFNVLMECIVRTPLHGNVTLLSYADDLALVCTGRGDRVRRAQKALDSVTTACQDLGLRVSAEKSKAMAVLTASPEATLTIQGARLEWCAHYQYLGVWIDQRLTFNKEIQYLRERSKIRVALMRAMTRTGAGATYRVLRLYYVQAVRSLVDYAAVALVSLSDTLKVSLERIQNDALRHILGAPRWTKLEALQAETDLLPLTRRVDQQAASWVARTILRPADTPARRRLLSTLPQDDRVFTTKTWAGDLARTTRRLLPSIDLVGRGADEKVEEYITPPPWAAEVATFHVAPLPHRKSLCSSVALRAHTDLTHAHAAREGTRSYYTDGSVEPQSGRTAAALVCGGEALGWRTSDHCSTLQTELVAILTALQHARHHNDVDITIYTDSMGALQALQRNRLVDNVRLITSVLHNLTRLREQGRTVTLAWIPSHVGTPGNEAADAEAKRALTQDRVRIPIPHSLQQLKTLVKRTALQEWSDHLRRAEATSTSLRWYANATGYEPLTLPAAVSRRNRVRLHRLRLGYPTVRSLGTEYEGEICSLCQEHTDEPLVHFLLDCDVTGPLRTLAARRGHADGEDRWITAARMVRYMTDDPGALRRITTMEPPR